MARQAVARLGPVAPLWVTAWTRGCRRHCRRTTAPAMSDGSSAQPCLGRPPSRPPAAPCTGCWRRPPCSTARADQQAAVVGGQAAGRVAFFLRVDDFDAAHRRITNVGVRFLAEPRREPYGRVAVFLDLYGNRWDLLGPALMALV